MKKIISIFVCLINNLYSAHEAPDLNDTMQHLITTIVDKELPAEEDYYHASSMPLNTNSIPENRYGPVNISTLSAPQKTRIRSLHTENKPDAITH